MKMTDGQHLQYNGDGTWSLRRAGSSRAFKRFQLKFEAFEHAKALAARQGIPLYIHRVDGTIEAKVEP